MTRWRPLDLLLDAVGDLPSPGPGPRLLLARGGSGNNVVVVRSSCRKPWKPSSSPSEFWLECSLETWIGLTPDFRRVRAATLVELLLCSVLRFGIVMRIVAN